MSFSDVYVDRTDPSIDNYTVLGAVKNSAFFFCIGMQARDGVSEQFQSK